jgi:hypothetical protein
VGFPIIIRKANDWVSPIPTKDGSCLVTRGSSPHNLKELRPGSASRTEIQILFIFDPHRQAVLLVAGDKTGNSTHWYRDAIKLVKTAAPLSRHTARGDPMTRH